MRGWGRMSVVIGAGALAAVLVAGPALATAPASAPPDIDAATWAAQMRQRMYGSRAPGSLLRGSTASMTPIQRIAGVGRSVSASAATGSVVVPSLATGTAAKFGTVARGVGNVVTGLFALDLTYTLVQGGYAGGPGFMGLEGFESEGLLCDLQNVVGSRCSVGPGPGYLANGDVVAGAPPGWAGSNTITHGATPIDWWSPYSVSFEVLSAPAWNTAGSIELEGAISGTPYPGAENSGITPTVSAMSATRDNTGGTMFTPALGSKTSTGGYLATLVEVFTTNGAFDHLEVQIDGGAPAAGLLWYPVGHSLRPAVVDPDPARWWTTEWLCEGEAPHTATSDVWHESDPEWPAPPEPTCDASALTHVSVTENADGLAPALLYEWDLPAELAAATETWAGAYPQCTDGSCILELARIDPETSTRLACFDNPALCLDWFADPAKTDNYVCTYGGQDVALSECNMYAPTFDPAKRTTGGTFADPATGEEPNGTPVSVPTEDTSCPPPFSWSALFNPWFYYKGVTCALEWAFVPPAGQIATEVQTTGEILSARPPWSLIEPIGAVFTGLGAGWSTGCSELPDFDPYGNGLRLPCDPPQSAWMTVLRALGTFAVVVGTGFGVWHMVVAAIGGRQADA